VVEDGWEAATEKFNELYGKQDKKDERDPNVLATTEPVSESFKLEDLKNLQRISSMTLGTIAAQTAGNPAAQSLTDEFKRRRRLIERLYSLVPKDSSTVDAVPLVMEFKPDMSYYCLKNVSIKRLNQEQYERIKAMRVYKEDFVQSQSLAPVHFSPENILKRMNFRLARQDEQTPDANAPAEFKGAS
jgi:hypothetical protein